MTGPRAGRVTASAGLQEVADQLPDTILILADRDLRYVLAAGGGLERTGWRVEELLGHRPRELMPEGPAAVVEEHMTAALKGETTTAEALPSSRKDLIWEARFAPLRDRDGTVTGTIFLSRDVTEKHRMDERLLQSTERFHTTVDALLDGVAILAAVRDESGAVTDLRWEYANPAACAAIGRDLDQLRGSRLLDVFPSEKASGFFDRLVRTVETGEPLFLEIPRVSEWAVPGAFDVRGVRLGDGLVLTVRDITDRVRSEKLLKDSEERFRVTLDSAACGIANLALDGRFLRVNRPYCEITGYSPEELRRRKVHDMLHPDDLDPTSTRLGDFILQRIHEPPKPKRYVRKDGSIVWVLLNGAVLRDAHGEPYECVATATDITSEHEAREEVARLNTELEERVQRRTAELEAALATLEAQKSRAESMQRFQSSLARLSRIESICEFSLLATADQAGADAGTMHLADEGSGAIVMRASRGVRTDDVHPEVVPGVGLAGRAIAEKRPVVASYPETSMKISGLAGDHAIRHELYVPLLHRDNAIGVVGLGRCRDAEFTKDEIDTIAWMCDRTSISCTEAFGLRQVETMAQERQDLMDSTDEGMFRFDLDGRITFINRAALELTGYQAEELLGADAHQAVHHHHPDGSPYPTEECPITRTAELGKSVRLPKEVYWRKDGSSFPVEVSSSPLRNGTKVIGAVVTFFDVTKRRLAERELAAQYRTSRTLAVTDSVAGALPPVLAAVSEELSWDIALAWQPDPDGSGLRCTAAFHRLDRDPLAGYLTSAGPPNGDGAAGQSWQRRHTVFHPGRYDAGLPPAEPPAPPLTGDLAVPALDSAGEVRLILEFLGHDDEVSQRMTETVEAVTAQLGQYVERKRAEESAVRAKDEFVATVSHDLRAPLTAINAWLELLLDSKPGPLTDRQRDSLTTIKDNSDQLMQMINDLLVLGEMDMELRGAEFTDIDVARLAREAAELYRPAAAQHGIELSVRTEPVVIQGDATRIRQLISNLLSNAVKFTGGGGQVDTAVTRKDGRCVIEVADTGIGVPERERARLFERFYRGSNAKEGEIPGTGLGLAICRAIAELHHGTIWLANSSDKGSRFLVELPVNQA